jgi:hypothetical protein
MNTSEEKQTFAISKYPLILCGFIVASVILIGSLLAYSLRIQKAVSVKIDSLKTENPESLFPAPSEYQNPFLTDNENENNQTNNNPFK